MVCFTAEHVPDIDQTDVAPTLSVLLGLPIPINNLGVVIDTAMEGFSLKDRTMALWRNAVQVSEVLRHNIPDTELGLSLLKILSQIWFYIRFVVSSENTE